MHTLVYYLLFHEQQTGWIYSLKFCTKMITGSWYDKKWNLSETLLLQMCPINTSLNSTVGRVNSLWDGWPMNCHSLFWSFQEGSMTHPTSSSVGLSLRVKWLFCETGHSEPSSAAQGQIYFTFMKARQGLLSNRQIKHKQLYGFPIMHCLHPQCK
jgi:hypothetical protein